MSLLIGSPGKRDIHPRVPPVYLNPLDRQRVITAGWERGGKRQPDHSEEAKKTIKIEQSRSASVLKTCFISHSAMNAFRTQRRAPASRLPPAPEASLNPATTTPDHRCAVSLCHPSTLPPPLCSTASTGSSPTTTSAAAAAAATPPPSTASPHIHLLPLLSFSQKNKHQNVLWEKKKTRNFTSAKRRRWVLKADSRQPWATDVPLPPLKWEHPPPPPPLQLSCT